MVCNEEQGYGLHVGLFINTEDRGDMFLRNVGWLSTDYTALYSKR
jgi:hypothetical protein